MSNVIEFPIKNEQLSKENAERLEKNNLHNIEEIKTRRALKERMDIVKNMLSRINDILKIIDTSGQAFYHFDAFYGVQQILSVLSAQKSILMAEKIEYEKKLEEIQRQYAKQGENN